jgi:hypothetical protein
MSTDGVRKGHCRAIDCPPSVCGGEEGTSDSKAKLTSFRENSFQCEAKLVIGNFRFSIVDDKYIAVKSAHVVRYSVEWSLQS